MGALGPDRYVAAVERIDLEELRRSGVRAILLDRDNTIVPRDHETAPPAVEAWLDRARALGFSLYIVSNNFHRSQVARSSDELGMGFISHAMKPAPFALKRALARLGIARREAVMIGDQIYTDVWAGKLAGIRTILVKPQSREDLWYTQIFRIFERRALRDVPCEE